MSTDARERYGGGKESSWRTRTLAPCHGTSGRDGASEHRPTWRTPDDHRCHEPTLPPRPAAATLARAAPVAEGETIHVGDEHTTATSRTFLKNSTTDDDVLVMTTNGGGKAIWGKSTGGVGVRAESVDDTGLHAVGPNTTANTFRIRVSTASTKPINIAWLLVG